MVRIYVSKTLTENKKVIDGQLLDLFENENIEITLKQSDIKDFGNWSDFSKTFSVPASKNNNKIFRYWADIFNSNQFPSVQGIPANIEIDGIVFKSGTIKITEGSKDDGGKLKNYSISFTGSLKSLKDKFGEDSLAALNFAGLGDLQSIQWTSENVFGLLSTNALYSGVAVPLISINRPLDNYEILKYPQPPNATEIEASELRASISCGRLLRLIEDSYSVKFLGELIDNQNSLINKLHLWCNKNESAIGGNQQIFKFNGSQMPLPATNNFFQPGDAVKFDIAQNLIILKKLPPTTLITQKYVFSTLFTPSAPFADKNYQIYLQEVVLKNNGDVDEIETNRLQNGGFIFKSDTLQGTHDRWLYEWNLSGWPNDTVRAFRIKAESDEYFEFAPTTLLVKQYSTYLGWNSVVINHTLFSPIFNYLEATFSIAKSLPDMKVQDFMDSLFKTFNIMCVPIDDQATQLKYKDKSIYRLRYYNEYYTSGNEINITKYAQSDHKVKALKNYKKIDLKHAESKFGANGLYKNAQYPARDYGQVSHSDKNVNDGDYKIETKFNILIFDKMYAPSLPEQTQAVKSWICANSTNDSGSPSLNVPTVFFYNGLSQHPSNQAISYKTYAGVIPLFQHNIFSNLDNINSDFLTTSLLFSAENIFGGMLEQRNLYRFGYESIIKGIYSPYSREYEISAVLPKKVYTNLELSTSVIIGNMRYHINEITINLTDGVSKLKLTNVYQNSDFEQKAKNSSEIVIQPPLFFSSDTKSGQTVISWNSADNSRGITKYIIEEKIGDEFHQIDEIITDLDYGEITTNSKAKDFRITAYDYSGKQGYGRLNHPPEEIK